MSDEIRVRVVGSDDREFLKEMTFQALYQRRGEPTIARSILKNPSISRYFLDFADRHGDEGKLVYQNLPSAPEAPIAAA